MIRSVAILAQHIKLFDCENFHRVVVPTGIEDIIMVIITKKVSVFNQDPDEMNDDDDWVLGSYAQTREMYDKEFTTNFPRILPADLICIGTKSDPIPLKDVSDNFLDEFKGKYLG